MSKKRNAYREATIDQKANNLEDLILEIWDFESHDGTARDLAISILDKAKEYGLKVSLR